MYKICLIFVISGLTQSNNLFVLCLNQQKIEQIMLHLKDINR